MTEDWELDFSNPPRIVPTGHCDNCYDRLPQKHVIVQYQLGMFLADYHYCCEDCRWEHKLTLQRESGL